MTRDEFINALQKFPREANVFVCDEGEELLKMQSLSYEDGSIFIHLRKIKVAELNQVNQALGKGT